MAYRRAQLISYQLNTSPQGTATPPYNQQYLGRVNSKGETWNKLDISGRCRLMKRAMRAAYQSDKLSADRSVLKIFMAPEFYFRGADGAYPVEEIPGIIEKMREVTRLPTYKDWLFVFGTALGYFVQDGDTTGARETVNAALVQKGGVAGPPGETLTSLIVYKEFRSSIDFIRAPYKIQCPHCAGWLDAPWATDVRARGGLIGASTGSPATDMKPLRPTSGSRDLLSTHVNFSGEGRENNKKGIGGQGIFTIDGVTFGLEVCLDHNLHRLRDSPPATGDDLIQIHLIPASGVYILESSVACMQGGLVFNVDGYQWGPTAPMSQTRVCRNAGTYDAPKLEATTFNIIDTCQLAGIDNYQGWEAYFVEPGAVHLFEVLDIPPAAKK